VKRALNDLVKTGFMGKKARFDKERKHGGQTSNLYVLKVVEPKGEVEKYSRRMYPEKVLLKII